MDGVNSLVAFGFVAAFVVYITVLIWYQQAAKAWQESAHPGQGGSPVGQILAAQSTFRAMSQPATDPRIEQCGSGRIDAG